MVKQLMLPCVAAPFACNRCNAEKENTAPCARCGCPEFRIVARGVDRKRRCRVPSS